MKEQTEPDQALFIEWQGHQTTQWFATNVQRDVARALKVLINRARYSSDPKVTTAVAHFDTLNSLLRTLTEKPKDETEGDSGTDSGDR